eukprot:EC714527.1.p3 GENE.EC714527.1~~EC714527.1.p3  ORF type:complete len:59 (-),score=7.98 EC714527.1:266-442(-)
MAPDFAALAAYACPSPPHPPPVHVHRRVWTLPSDDVVWMWVVYTSVTTIITTTTTRVE